MYRSANGLKIGVVCILILAFIVSIVVVPVSQYSKETTYTITVTDKQVKRSGETDIYLVFAKDSDGNVKVFKNEDSLIKGKFDSSDMQSQLEIGKTYTVSTYGYRIPIMSMYENIYECKEVK